jgi:glycosyltransferase involved in cell wall biosynthesis
MLFNFSVIVLVQALLGAASPKRVLHIGKYYPPFAGGMENFLGDLLPALVRRGVAVGALVHRDHETHPIVECTEPKIYRAPSHGRLMYAPVSPEFPIWLHRAIYEFEPDVLHIHLPNTSAFWVLASPSARRLPWVLHWHSDVVPSRLDRRLIWAYRIYRMLERRLLALSHVVIATSAAYLESSIALREWRNKCHVIPLGLDPERLPDPKPADMAWANSLWGPNHVRILAAGRFTYYKGYEVLVAAARHVPGSRLLIVGAGDRLDKLRALVASLKLEQIVTLLGAQTPERLNALLATCDCLCLPSVERTEAFGLVLLEAMKFAKPIVASNIPGSGIGWVIQENQNGLLVAPSDPGALAASLRILGADANLRERLGRNGAQRLHSHFHIDLVARSLANLYETVSR